MNLFKKSSFTFLSLGLILSFGTPLFSDQNASSQIETPSIQEVPPNTSNAIQYKTQQVQFETPLAPKCGEGYYFEDGNCYPLPEGNDGND